MFAPWYWMKEAILGLFRNFKMNITSFNLCIACFLFFTISYILLLNIDYMANELDKKIQIDVFLKDNVTDYSGVAQKLKSIPEIKSFTFVSKEEAFAEAKTMLGKNADLLEQLQKNPLPAKYVVELTYPEDYKQVADEIGSWNIADEINYGDGLADKLLRWTKMARYAGFGFSLFLALSAIGVVNSAIKTNVLGRQKEIKVKNLIGASKLSIRLPFMIEAVLLTVVASLVVYVGLYYGYEKLVVLVENTCNIGLVGQEDVFRKMFVPLELVAIFIGMFGSYFPTKSLIRKHTSL